MKHPSLMSFGDCFRNSRHENCGLHIIHWTVFRCPLLDRAVEEWCDKERTITFEQSGTKQKHYPWHISQPFHRLGLTLESPLTALEPDMHYLTATLEFVSVSIPAYTEAFAPDPMNSVSSMPGTSISCTDQFSRRLPTSTLGAVIRSRLGPFASSSGLMSNGRPGRALPDLSAQ